MLRYWSVTDKNCRPELKKQQFTARSRVCKKTVNKTLIYCRGLSNDGTHLFNATGESVGLTVPTHHALTTAILRSTCVKLTINKLFQIISSPVDRGDHMAAITETQTLKTIHVYRKWHFTSSMLENKAGILVAESKKAPRLIKHTDFKRCSVSPAVTVVCKCLFGGNSFLYINHGYLFPCWHSQSVQCMLGETFMHLYHLSLWMLPSPFMAWMVLYSQNLSLKSALLHLVFANPAFSFAALWVSPAARSPVHPLQRCFSETLFSCAQSLSFFFASPLLLLLRPRRNFPLGTEKEARF